MTSENALLSAIEKVAVESPDAVAYASAGADEVTYGELWRTSGLIAGVLVDCVEGRSPIIVTGEKDALIVATFLACLRSGHAFVPIDAELPVARVHNIASQIGGAVILSTCDLRPELKDELDHIATIFDARELLASAYGFVAPSPDVWVTGEETQYIIFTSGSTGRPKGIEVTANDVTHFMASGTTSRMSRPTSGRPTIRGFEASVMTPGWRMRTSRAASTRSTSSAIPCTPVGRAWCASRSRSTTSSTARTMRFSVEPALVPRRG